MKANDQRHMAASAVSVAAAGFTLVELLVVTVVVGLAAFVFSSAVSQAIMGSPLTALGTRGKDIYVAITGANSERELLGLSPLWPADGGEFDFTNSTDYFRYLFEEERFGTPEWAPFVAGFDYSKLAGSGVPICTNNRLTAACNAWTIAKNVGADTDETIPVLVTRNVDASSLASPMTVTNSQWTLRYGITREAPFRDKGLVLIQKNGAIFRARDRDVTYGIIYRGAQHPETQAACSSELRYLTPLCTVEPGETAYKTGLANQYGTGGVFIWRLKKEVDECLGMVFPMSAFWGVIYLVGAVVAVAVNKVSQKTVPISVYHVGLSCLHFFAAVLYSIFYFVHLRWDFRVFPIYVFLLAISVQLLSGVLVVLKHRKNREACAHDLKWALSAPLLVGGMCFALFVLMFVVTCLGF